MLISIPPKYAVAQVVGFIKGEERDPHRPDTRGAAERAWSAFLGARVLVSTVGRNEAVIRRYIREQEREGRRLDQLQLD
jgi:putative transposase